MPDDHATHPPQHPPVDAPPSRAPAAPVEGVIDECDRAYLKSTVGLDEEALDALCVTIAVDADVPVPEQIVQEARRTIDATPNAPRRQRRVPEPHSAETALREASEALDRAASEIDPPAQTEQTATDPPERTTPDQEPAMTDPATDTQHPSASDAPSPGAEEAEVPQDPPEGAPTPEFLAPDPVDTPAAPHPAEAAIDEAKDALERASSDLDPAMLDDLASQMAAHSAPVDLPEPPPADTLPDHEPPVDSAASNDAAPSEIESSEPISEPDASGSAPLPEPEPEPAPADPEPPIPARTSDLSEPDDLLEQPEPAPEEPGSAETQPAQLDEPVDLETQATGATPADDSPTDLEEAQDISAPSAGEPEPIDPDRDASADAIEELEPTGEASALASEPETPGEPVEQDPLEAIESEPAEPEPDPAPTDESSAEQQPDALADPPTEPDPEPAAPPAPTSAARESDPDFGVDLDELAGEIDALLPSAEELRSSSSSAHVELEEALQAAAQASPETTAEPEPLADLDEPGDPDAVDESPEAVAEPEPLADLDEPGDPDAVDESPEAVAEPEPVADLDEPEPATPAPASIEDVDSMLADEAEDVAADLEPDAPDDSEPVSAPADSTPEDPVDEPSAPVAASTPEPRAEGPVASPVADAPNDDVLAALRHDLPRVATLFEGKPPKIRALAAKTHALAMPAMRLVSAPMTLVPEEHRAKVSVVAGITLANACLAWAFVIATRF